VLGHFGLRQLPFIHRLLELRRENSLNGLGDEVVAQGVEAGIPAGTLAEVDRYIGYFKPYATSHVELDADWAMQGEVPNAARALLEAAFARRSGRMIGADETLNPPR
jgi:hypothetical protein